MLASAYEGDLMPTAEKTDKELSVLNLLRQAEEGATYLEKIPETDCYTFKIDGMHLKFVSDQAFNFVEVETLVE